MPENLTSIISSATRSVKINRGLPTVLIGERINPTGRKKLQAELREGDFDLIRKDVLAQVAAGADILDINVGVPDCDETTLLRDAIREVVEVTDAPLSIDTANPKALEAALAVYPGKALVNSVNGEPRSLAVVLPLVKEHRAAVIGLCLDENGIPDTPQKRLSIAERILNHAVRLGIATEDVIIDPLVLTMGANPKAGHVTLDTIKLVATEFGVNLTMGTSNVSFGMPDRRYINAAFLAMAIQAGVTCPIINPLEEETIAAVLAADLAMGRDEFGLRWVNAFRKRQKEHINK